MFNLVVDEDWQRVLREIYRRSPRWAKGSTVMAVEIVKQADRRWEGTYSLRVIRGFYF